MSPTTKYEQIADTLAARCASLPQGTRLPTEAALAKEFNVSRMTVRQALERLNENMVVVRSRGRGTFVQRPRVTKNQQLTSFTEDMYTRGITASTRLVRLDDVPCDDQLADSLGLSPRTEVVRAERLRFGGEEPMCHETVYLPPRTARKLSASDYERSLHAALRRIGETPVSATRYISAASLSAHVAPLLETTAGASSLRVKHLFRDDQGTPLYLADSFYHADRYEIVTDVERLE
ncbi:GntR family transcriptional regulator [Nesterenkonia haasae]|uniref:GntR family transcriptional regulator n=1 Tax=Nesterenkonia haasae TaxID=2587813 RepID=UPI0013910E75|nr:GntR family transcriptional regulator [Nesterenkonia haasae]NDK32211.1 GntR family transcriptional regulator [Nesterenkonia haasae]